MASLTGYNKVFASDTTAIDSSLKHPLGTRAFDTNGNEYIYLTGIASTEAGSWVSFDELHETILTVGNAKGRIGIAMAAIAPGTASAFGWYQIYGKNSLSSPAAAIVNDTALYLTATAGRVDDTDVAGDLINGAVSRCTVTYSHSSPLIVELNYPFVNDAADD